MDITAARDAGIFLAKLAAEKEEKKVDPVLEASKGTLGLLGAGLTVAPAKERITGRKILYHGTAPELVQKIREEGLRPPSRTGMKGITEAVLGKEVAQLPLVYAHPSKSTARYYQEQQKALLRGGKGELRAFRRNLLARGGKLPPGPPHGVLRLEIPHGAAKFVPNPEAPSLRAGLKKGLDVLTSYDLAHRTKAIEGGVAPQHIVGGKGFKKLTLREVADYAKKHPGRVAGGTALGLAGLGAAAYGGKKLYDAARALSGPSSEEQG